MFGRLTDLRYPRNFAEAIGFYLVTFVAGTLAIGLTAWPIALIDPNFRFDQGLAFGTLMATIASPVLSLAILRAKGLLGHPGYLILAILSGPAAAAGGLLLGLIVAAILSTRYPTPVKHGAAY